MILEEEITEKIIASAIEVHRQLGPGLLESVYERCMCYELSVRKMKFERQKSIPLNYKKILFGCGYRADLVVSGKVVVELKCVDQIGRVHQAQLITYLRVSGLRVGLILNFNVPVLKCAPCPPWLKN